MGLFQDGGLLDGLHGRQVARGLRAGTIREVDGEQGGEGNGKNDADMGLGAADEAEGAGFLGFGHGLGVEGVG